MGDSCVDNTFSSCRAFLYQGGVAIDLNSLVQPNSSFDLILANDVNDAGEIVGFALDNATGSIVAFLAVPISNSAQLDAAASHSPRALPDTIRRIMPGWSRFSDK